MVVLSRFQIKIWSRNYLKTKKPLLWIEKGRGQTTGSGVSGARRLSDSGNQSENSTGRGQVLSILPVNSCSIDQASGEIWSVQTNLQQIFHSQIGARVPFSKEGGAVSGDTRRSQTMRIYPL